MVPATSSYSYGGSETVANAVLNNDAPLKVIGANFQKNPFCILYLADDPIPDPEAMKGKTIGVQTGQRADLAGPAAGQQPGGGRRPRPGEEGAGRLRADAARERRGEGFFSFITNEPNILRVKGLDVGTLNLSDVGITLYQQLYTVTEESLETSATSWSRPCGPSRRAGSTPSPTTSSPST